MIRQYIHRYLGMYDRYEDSIPLHHMNSVVLFFFFGPAHNLKSPPKWSRLMRAKESDFSIPYSTIGSLKWLYIHEVVKKAKIYRMIHPCTWSIELTCFPHAAKLQLRQPPLKTTGVEIWRRNGNGPSNQVSTSFSFTSRLLLFIYLFPPNLPKTSYRSKGKWEDRRWVGRRKA